jgi:hypothetical protein
LEIFERFKEGFEEPDELPGDRHLIVSTDKTLEETLTQVLTGIISKGLS